MFVHDQADQRLRCKGRLVVLAGTKARKSMPFLDLPARFLKNVLPVC